MTTIDSLFVPELAPALKHPTILKKFDELNAGESFLLINDHDPIPLFHEMKAEKGEAFTWDYLEKGPMWRVQIRKINGNVKTLGEIAAKDIRKAEIFKKYGLDFCCGGKKTVQQACAEKGMDATVVEEELHGADKNPVTRPLPYNDWSLDYLADYIVQTHHSYVRKALPEIRAYAAKVATVHGGLHPELAIIRGLVEETYAEMSSHMVKEEKVLFPFIKQLVNTAVTGQLLPHPHFGTVENPIHMMEHEHEAVGRNLEQIRKLSNNYTLPADACASYSLLYSMLEEFESDVFIHVHLENNILFPKALQLERKVRK